MTSVVIGLGNIGQKYARTRHNIGFEVLDIIANKWGMRPRPGSGDYFLLEKELEEKQVKLVWPTTYMNNSGRAVRQVMEEFNVLPENILIVFDDYNLPLGKIRVRKSGSDGGHNGISSIIYHLETENVPRLRIGIGPIPEGADTVDYVLGQFSDKESEIVEKMLEKSASAVLYSLNNRLEEAMTIYNTNPAPDNE